MPRPVLGRPAALCPQGSGPALLRILRGEWRSAGRSRLHQPGLSVPAGTPAAPHSGPVSSLWPWPLSTPRAPKQKCVWARPSGCQCPQYMPDPAFLGTHRWPQGLAQDPKAAARPRGSQGGPRVPATPAWPCPRVRSPPSVICLLPFALSPGLPQGSQAPQRVCGGPQLTSSPGFPMRSHPQGSGGSPVITVEETWALSQQQRRPKCRHI